MELARNVKQDKELDQEAKAVSKLNVRRMKSSIHKEIAKFVRAHTNILMQINQNVKSPQTVWHQRGSTF